MQSPWECLASSYKMDKTFQGNEMNNTLQNTQTRENLLISSVPHYPLQWWWACNSTVSGQPVKRHTFISQWRRRRKIRVLQRAEVISCASRLRQKKIKCLHLVGPALFQMPTPPFKRALVGTDGKWALLCCRNLSPFSCSPCHFQPPALSLM